MGLDIVIYNKNKKQVDIFRAGSYSGFNWFRLILSELSQELIELNSKGVNTEKIPFFSILFDSDCSGKIGLKNCRKLLKDFNNPKMRDSLILLSLKDDWDFDMNIFMVWFRRWKKGLKQAVENKGFLLFY